MARDFIVCVDDERSVRDTVVADLKKRYGNRFQYEMCESAAEAQALREDIKSKNQRVAIYIVDQRMPGIEGIDFLKTVEKDAGKMLLTAYADTQVAIKGINEKCIDFYIQKTEITGETNQFFDSIDLLIRSWEEKDAALKAKQNRALVPLDTAWFDQRMEEYLASDSFKMFAELAGVDLRDLVSSDLVKVATAQKKIVSQSIIFNEIQGEHAGFRMPVLYYTHDLRLADPISNHNIDLDKAVIAFDQGDSLRRRLIALSYSLIPKQISTLSDQFGKPITIKNLGSGIGLDAVNAVRFTHANVGQIVNVDINETALAMGKNMVDYLVRTNQLERDKVIYKNESFLSSDSNNSSHLSLMVGVICGLTDYAAGTLLKRAYKGLEPGGSLIVTCANEYMRDTDPSANFLIQHIGTRKDPTMGWGLNFRKKEDLQRLMESVGFKDIVIYDDANFDGKDKLPQEVYYGVDSLPALAAGMKPVDGPLSLPSKQVFEKSIGYNWIGIGTKEKDLRM